MTHATNPLVPRTDLTEDQLRSMVASGQPPVIIDVRDPDERAGRSIPGSVNYPLGWFAVWSHALEPDAAVVCVCATGRRSRYASDALAAKGFSKVYNLLGGMAEWQGDVESKIEPHMCGLHRRLLWRGPEAVLAG